MKNKIVNILKLTIFSIVFLLLFNGISHLLVYVPTDTRPYQAIKGFALEEDDSLDAVFIGSSSTFAYWNPLMMWNEYGITTYNYSVPSMPIEAYKYMIEEGRKTQANALYVLTITDPTVGSSKTVVYRFANNMSFSTNKIKLIKALLDNLKYDVDPLDRVQYYVPIIKFHTRWAELTYEDDFNRELTGYKNSSLYSSYLKKITDFTDGFNMTDERYPLAENTQTIMNELLDYCDANNVNVLFLIAPQVKMSDQRMGELNTIKDLAESRNYPVLDGRLLMDEMGIDVATDYYNEWHTNIHGSIKYSLYVADYLIDNYKFSDKRQDDKFANWNETYQEYYTESIDAYYLDIELDVEHRDYTIDKPDLLKLTQSKSKNTLTWKSSESEVDGYLIYRKQGNNYWRLFDTVAADATSYVDDISSKPDKMFTYTVVPYVLNENGEMMYGNFDYLGLKIQAEIK